MSQILDWSIEAQARARQSVLTKPAGSLGRLEELACWFAGRLRHVTPEMPRAEVFVFAADHGVAARGVSAYPQSVTAAMVQNFARGGAAINVLARLADARIEVVDVGVASDVPAPAGVRRERIAKGTRDITSEPAMTFDQLQKAFDVADRCVGEAESRGARLLVAGEMGIGNTTAAACLICALTGASPEEIVGRGTGIDDKRLAHKIATVTSVVARLKSAQAASPFKALAEVGGFELAAIAGFYVSASRRGIPVVLDGYLSAAAALAAVAIEPESRDWMVASHLSTEHGHAAALNALKLEPLFDLKMRLGEGTGAALALSLIRAALALHKNMATFADAGIEGPSPTPLERTIPIPAATAAAIARKEPPPIPSKSLPNKQSARPAFDPKAEAAALIAAASPFEYDAKSTSASAINFAADSKTFAPPQAPKPVERSSKPMPVPSTTKPAPFDPKAEAAALVAAAVPADYSKVDAKIDALADLPIEAYAPIEAFAEFEIAAPVEVFKEPEIVEVVKAIPPAGEMTKAADLDITIDVVDLPTINAPEVTAPEETAALADVAAPVELVAPVELAVAIDAIESIEVEVTAPAEIAEPVRDAPRAGIATPAQLEVAFEAPALTDIPALADVPALAQDAAQTEFEAATPMGTPSDATAPAYTAAPDEGAVAAVVEDFAPTADVIPAEVEATPEAIPAVEPTAEIVAEVFALDTAPSDAITPATSNASVDVVVADSVALALSAEPSEVSQLNESDAPIAVDAPSDFAHQSGDVTIDSIAPVEAVAEVGNVEVDIVAPSEAPASLGITKPELPPDEAFEFEIEIDALTLSASASAKEQLIPSAAITPHVEAASLQDQSTHASASSTHADAGPSGTADLLASEPPPISVSVFEPVLAPTAGHVTPEVQPEPPRKPESAKVFVLTHVPTPTRTSGPAQSPAATIEMTASAPELVGESLPALTPAAVVAVVTGELSVSDKPVVGAPEKDVAKTTEEDSDEDMWFIDPSEITGRR